MKKWLPIFLISIMLASTAVADETTVDDTTTNPEENTTETPTDGYENPNPGTDTEDNTEPGTTEPGNYNENPSVQEPGTGEENNYDNSYDNNTYEEPTYDESTFEEPVYEEPTYEEPVYEEPAEEEPLTEEIKTENFVIKGQVKINGELAKDVEVVVTGDAKQTVQTNDNGKFEFTELSPGKYIVSVNYEESEADISPIEVEITDRDKVNINFDITSDEKKEEKTKKESLIKSEDSKEDEGMPTYLKWLIVVVSILIPVSVIFYFVFKRN